MKTTKNKVAIKSLIKIQREIIFQSILDWKIMKKKTNIKFAPAESKKYNPRDKEK